MLDEIAFSGQDSTSSVGELMDVRRYFYIPFSIFAKDKTRHELNRKKKRHNNNSRTWRRKIKAEINT